MAAPRYAPTARLLHWTIAGLILVVLVFGIWMTFFEPKDDAFKLKLYDIHQSFGLVVWVLMLARLAFRATHPPPPLPGELPRGLRAAAHANHAALYALLLVQPVTGFLATNAWGFPLTWFWLVPIPSPVGREEYWAPILSALHDWGGRVIILLLVMHLGGAAFHAIIRRDGVVRRMA